MFNSSTDKFGQAFVLVLETILGPLAITHHNRNRTTYYYLCSGQFPMTEWSNVHRFDCFVTVAVQDSSPWLTTVFFFFKANEPFFTDEFRYQ